MRGLLTFVSFLLITGVALAAPTLNIIIESSNDGGETWNEQTNYSSVLMTDKDAEFYRASCIHLTNSAPEGRQIVAVLLENSTDLNRFFVMSLKAPSLPGTNSTLYRPVIKISP